MFIQIYWDSYADVMLVPIPIGTFLTIGRHANAASRKSLEIQA